MPGAESLLRGIQAELAGVAERLARVTVQVHAGGRSAGAGVIWLRDGAVVTNAHVATGPRAELVLPDGRSLPARLIARDRRHDLALLRTSAEDLEPALHADARGLRAGELVVALGHPLGVAYATALGVVHRPPSGAPGPAGWLHADIRHAPGNSGGPLADTVGRVGGINAMIVGGLGIAVPTHVVEDFVRAAGSSQSGGERAA